MTQQVVAGSWSQLPRSHRPGREAGAGQVEVLDEISETLIGLNGQMLCHRRGMVAQTWVYGRPRTTRPVATCSRRCHPQMPGMPPPAPG